MSADFLNCGANSSLRRGLQRVPCGALAQARTPELERWRSIRGGGKAAFAVAAGGSEATAVD
jgi:hypothetical protein